MDVKGKLKDWLHATGKDIAQAVGSHIKEKGVAYAKEQLGLGLDAEMHGKGLEMSGEGAGDWLKSAALGAAVIATLGFGRAPLVRYMKSVLPTAHDTSLKM